MAGQPRTGAQLLVDCLLAQGVDTLFCVPGESFLAVLDALYDVPDRIRVVVGRHEAGVANMAEAYGKLTGKPGICFVTRGPGASQGAVGVHTAQQDSTPFIMFVGQVTRDQLGREAFQEMDYRQMFGRTTKWVTEIVDVERIPELVGRAFHVASNGRSGPVVISLPEDMQNDPVSAEPCAHFRRAVAAPTAASLDEMCRLIAGSLRPLMILGGGGWSAKAVADIQHFAECFDLPVASGFRRQDLFDNCHPNYAGVLGISPNPALLDLTRDADLLIVIGERLGDMTSSGYTLFPFPALGKRLVHVHPGAEELGIVYEGDVFIAATAADFAEAASVLKPLASPSRGDRVVRAHADYEAFSIPPDSGQPRIDVARIIRELSDRLPTEAIITNGAGLYTAFVHRFYQFRTYGSQLAPTSGAMGYGLPAALAAKVVHPDRQVICFAGDGCFMMAVQELATAMQFGLAIVAVVIDNSSYGSIRYHQEKHFPGRTVATDLMSPDFVALAQSFGAYAELVQTTDGFAAAYDRAIASGLPALLTFKQDIAEVVPIGARDAE